MKKKMESTGIIGFRVMGLYTGYTGYIGVIGIFRVSMGIMEKNMETTITISGGYIRYSPHAASAFGVRALA